MIMQYPGSLHNHTDYSNIKFKDAISTTKGLIDKAIELGHSVVAFTEHDCICNAVKVEKYYNEIKKTNPDFKVIRGNEIYLCRDDLTPENYVSGQDKFYHFILLAKDAEGYRQIRELSTRAWLRSYVFNGLRRIPTYYRDIEEIIGGNPGHVIGATACLGGALGTQLMRYKANGQPQLYENILNWCKYLQGVFGKENFYLELQPSATEEQEYVNKELIKINKQLDIPYIITTDTHYLNKEDRGVHEAFLKSQEAEREVGDFYLTTYMMDTAELEGYLTYLTKEELSQAYQNISTIAKSCEDFTIFKPLRIPELKWKSPSIKEIQPIWYCYIPMLKTFMESSYEGDRVLARAIVERMSADTTLQNSEVYAEVNLELEYVWESSEVNKAHWSAYFLNLQNIIDLCWEAGSIVGPGRGSGVGFLILYILGITQINPLRETTKTYPWRFLNPSRVSVLDIDFDISGLKRQQVLNKFREEYGADRVCNVATFATEKSKSAILTAARGLGLSNDEAQYYAALVPSDRGANRTLKQCYYGDVENGFAPVANFVRAMDSQPRLWEVAQNIEGLICRMGIHAGGVIFVDEDIVNSTALMRAPDGTIISQFELHDLEDCSLIKYDALSVVAMDKIQTCLELLIEHGYVTPESTLRDTYEKVIGVYNLERDNERMWQMVWRHEIESLFQMEQQSGIQGIELTHPKSVDDLATLNSVIRLMAQDKDSEQPLHKYARFKEDITAWYKEMDDYGLENSEKELLKEVLGISYGICEAQERFMMLVQIPECGGLDLNFADQLRKAIAKKNPAAYVKLTEQYFENMEQKGLSKPLCNYVWNVLVATSRGYGFNLSHTLAYSLIALQEMNLAFRFPRIYWDCANLIVNSGGDDEEGEESGVNYEKIAIAINKMKSTANINISLIDINSSGLTFEPDAENNQIFFGLRALSGINAEIIEQIVAGRPYASLKDFMARCPLNKTQMISLIKAGAFDSLEAEWAQPSNIHPRVVAMGYYISKACEPKTKLNLQNFNGLIQKGLVPQSLDLERRVFEFNKYLKAYCKVGKYYTFDEDCIVFYSQLYDMDKLEVINGVTCILQTDWDNIYKKQMDAARNWLKEQQTEVLEELNFLLFREMWEKYATGSLASWEMQALCFYHSEHELAHLDTQKYGIVNFFELPEEPEAEKYFKKNGKQLPIWKTYRIAGTVIAKNDNKATITLLTPDGVVPIKFTKEYYAMYKKQISEIQEDGTKQTIEKGWFKRGTLLMLTGYRRGDQFVTKTYAHTTTHQIYKITLEEDGKNVTLTHERLEN